MNAEINFFIVNLDVNGYVLYVFIVVIEKHVELIAGSKVRLFAKVAKFLLDKPDFR